jgi:hypothetical protein
MNSAVTSDFDSEAGKIWRNPGAAFVEPTATGNPQRGTKVSLG